jgi:hypothetical protein
LNHLGFETSVVAPFNADGNGAPTPTDRKKSEGATYKRIHFWQEEYTDFHIIQTKLNPLKASDLIKKLDRIPTTKPAKSILSRIFPPISPPHQGTLST